MGWVKIGKEYSWQDSLSDACADKVLVAWIKRFIEHYDQGYTDASGKDVIPLASVVKNLVLRTRTDLTGLSVQDNNVINNFIKTVESIIAGTYVLTDGDYAKAITILRSLLSASSYTMDNALL